MKSRTEPISEAVIAFLGFGTASSPGQDQAKLIDEFGITHGTALASRVRRLMDEVGKFEIDWTTRSLEAAAEMLRARLRADHPELSDEALNALIWKFTFDWR